MFYTFFLSPQNDESSQKFERNSISNGRFFGEQSDIVDEQ
jgi:hypothetical protein